MDNNTAFKHEKPDDSAGFLLWKITSLWQDRLSEVLSDFGINQTQFAIMASLKWFEEHNEDVSQAHIVEHSKIDKMTVSKSIRKLEKSDLIIRAKSDTDARSFNIEFTEHGKHIINKSIIAIETADDKFFSNLSDNELNKYKQLTISIIGSNDL